MRTLLNVLQDYDPGQLRIIAELWGIDLPAGPSSETAHALSRAMLDPEEVGERWEALPASARAILDELLLQGGRLALAELLRRHGPLREMGPGRRDRDKPWRDPASPVEVLWYRGWIGRAFADAPAGPQEFAFIPSDLLALLPHPAPQPGEPLGRAADPPSWEQRASTAAVDDATTLLAALRRQGAPSIPLAASREHQLARFLFQPASTDLVLTLMQAEGLLAGSPMQPEPQATRAFLEAPRAECLRRLQQAWANSLRWNDLAHVPSLTVPDDAWPNDPLIARRAILGFLAGVPQGEWWSFKTFIQAIRQTDPGFQRPAGDFDSWYVQEASTRAFLHGIEHWDRVEGALLRYLISAPLHWLGVVDLGNTGDGDEPACFRLTSRSGHLLGHPSRGGEPDRIGAARIQSDGRITAPASVPRPMRYQIARFCVWEGFEQGEYRYRLSPGLAHAAQTQGLQLTHIRSILETASGRPLPDHLARALERAFARGTEARLERIRVLRLSDPRVLRELQDNKVTRRFLGETLGPAAILVHEQDWERLRAAAARLGLLIEPPDAPEDGPD
jgi:hypothetical protein